MGRARSPRRPRISPADADRLAAPSPRQRKQVEMLFAHLNRILRLDQLRRRGPNHARDEFLVGRLLGWRAMPARHFGLCEISWQWRGALRELGCAARVLLFAGGLPAVAVPTPEIRIPGPALRATSHSK
jgi:hypothetical protein